MKSSKQIKVLQVNKLYAPFIGGVERTVQDIAEGLKDKVDMKVLVCQPKGRTTKEMMNEVKYLIEAMQLVNAKLLIVGDSGLRENLEKETISFGMNG